MLQVIRRSSANDTGAAACSKTSPTVKLLPSGRAVHVVIHKSGVFLSTYFLEKRANTDQPCEAEKKCDMEFARAAEP